MCDYTSVDLDQDVDEADVVHRGYVGEHVLLHYNKAHRWYFLDGQEIDDIIVIRHGDSAGYNVPCM